MDSPDFSLLRTLFPADEGFRHKMGLGRREFGDFYAPTAAGPLIRREKAAVLDHEAGLYTVWSDGGRAAFEEFAASCGAGAATTGELSLQIEPDFLLVMPPGWTLAWASVCFPSRWSLEGKLGQPLPDLHQPVPGLNAELGGKIGTFLARLTPGEGWGRANWGLSASAQRNQHPTRPLPVLTAATPPEQTFLRVEDQHLLKLPRTGAVAFGIRIFSFRLSEAAADPAVRAGLQKKLRTMPPEVANYKGLARFFSAA